MRKRSEIREDLEIARAQLSGARADLTREPFAERAFEEKVRRAREELERARERAREAPGAIERLEQRVRELERELERASEASKPKGPGRKDVEGLVLSLLQQGQVQRARELALEIGRGADYGALWERFGGRTKG